MFTFDTQIRVRYGETDQMGYLYYGHYAQYFEVGRAETIRSLGISYKEMETDLGIMMPVLIQAIAAKLSESSTIRRTKQDARSAFANSSQAS